MARFAGSRIASWKARGSEHRCMSSCVFGFIRSSRNSSFFNTASTSSCSFFVLQGSGPFPFAQSSAICEQRGPISFFSFSVGKAGVEGLGASSSPASLIMWLPMTSQNSVRKRLSSGSLSNFFAPFFGSFWSSCKAACACRMSSPRTPRADGVTARESLSRTPSPRRYTSRYIRTPRNAPGISGSTCPSRGPAAWPSLLSNRA